MCPHRQATGSTSNVAAMTASVEPSDNYTGHVDPGTAARRTLPGATILKASVGPMDNNAYLVTCSATGETLLIDAANDADVLIDLIRRYAPEGVADRDQPSALRSLAGAGGRGRRPPARRPPRNEIDAEPLPVKPDRLLADGDTVQIGELTLRRHPPARAHARIDRAGPRRARDRRGHPIVHRRLPVPGRRRQDMAARRFRLSCSTTSPRGCSTCTTTPPSSTRATATTPVLGAERPHLGEWRERGW